MNDLGTILTIASGVGFGVSAVTVFTAGCFAWSREVERIPSWVFPAYYAAATLGLAAWAAGMYAVAVARSGAGAPVAVLFGGFVALIVAERLPRWFHWRPSSQSDKHAESGDAADGGGQVGFPRRVAHQCGPGR